MELSKFGGLDIILVCGLPAAGKSHFSAAHFGKSGRKRVNRKEIRKALYEMTSFGQKWSEKLFAALDEGLVKHVELKLIEHLLQSGQKVLVDNASVSEASRKTYVDLARHANKSIGVIFIHSQTITCLERNRSRDDPVPETVISNLAASMQLPGHSEGFKEVLVIEGY